MGMESKYLINLLDVFLPQVSKLIFYRYFLDTKKIVY